MQMSDTSNTTISHSNTRPATILIILFAVSTIVNIVLVTLILLGNSNIDKNDIEDGLTRNYGDIGRRGECRRDEDDDVSGDVYIVSGDGDQLRCSVRHAESIVHFIQLATMISVGLSKRMIHGDISPQGQKDVHKHRHLSSRQHHHRTGTNVLPSAHLFLDQHSFRGTSLTWGRNCGQQTSHVNGNIRLKRNSLCIKEDGFYQVYAFLTFKRRPNQYDVIAGHVNHFILRHNAKTSNVLLSMSVALPKKPGQYAISYLGETFKLGKGDLISVQLTDYSSVYNFSFSNYFGIHRLHLHA